MAMTGELETEEDAWVAAIHHDGSRPIDAALAEFATQQRQAGRRVLGLLMKPAAGDAGCQSAMVLTDIDTGDEYAVSQSLGKGSNACAADPQGFARASRVLRNALDQQPDLVIINRYGSLEAENGGFVAELLALLAQGIPVLTVVSTRHLDAWHRFIGVATLLPSDPGAWQAWLGTVMSKRGALLP
jgi:nucleoside-triphosphatase THEP1